MPEEPVNEPNGAIVNVDFVRGRNALLARSDLGPLFTDYYLHLADNQLHYTEEQATLFKNALAAFTLHCASRPVNEHLAWTISLQEPRLNLFLTGDNEDFTVAGRIFTENVRPAAENVFYSDVMPHRGAEARRSVINFAGSDLLVAAAGYYARSEQQPARYFAEGGDDYALLVAHPDCDLPWFSGVDGEVMRRLDTAETLAPIERRPYRWFCGCTQEKILGALSSVFLTDPEGLFGESETIRVECPRCAARHTLTREAMEAFVAKKKSRHE